MIDCIHDENKTKLTILFKGVKNRVLACSDCKKIIEESSICKVISLGWTEKKRRGGRADG